MATNKITMGLGTDPIVETSIKIIIGVGETTITEVATGIIDLITGIIVGPEIEMATEMVVDMMTGQIIEGKIVTKGMETEIRTTVDPEIEIGKVGLAPEKVPNPGAVVDPNTNMKIGDKVEMIPEIGTGLSQDQDPLLV